MLEDVEPLRKARDKKDRAVSGHKTLVITHRSLLQTSQNETTAGSCTAAAEITQLGLHQRNLRAIRRPPDDHEHAGFAEPHHTPIRNLVSNHHCRITAVSVPVGVLVGFQSPLLALATSIERGEFPHDELSSSKWDHKLGRRAFCPQR
jgi:hypothetical protein